MLVRDTTLSSATVGHAAGGDEKGKGRKEMGLAESGTDSVIDCLAAMGWDGRRWDGMEQGLVGRRRLTVDTGSTASGEGRDGMRRGLPI